jgi:4a-hydroxytetrahydrobiopterin dehydratase
MSALPQKEVSIALKTVPNWSKRALIIRRTFRFKDFLKSIEFVNRVARKAQKANHHPDIDIRYDQVTLALTTHDEGGLTEKDFSLAQECDEIFEKSGES